MIGAAISPVTPDHVNPEAPWPAIAELAERTAAAGKVLVAPPADLSILRRATSRPGLDPEIATQVRRSSDAEGLARDDDWAPGTTAAPPTPAIHAALGRSGDRAPSSSALQAGARLDEAEIVRLFAARDADYRTRCRARPMTLRRGDRAATPSATSSTATSTTPTSATTAASSAPSPRARRTRRCAARPMTSRSRKSCAARREAWERGATEVCLQGGIHPDYTGEPISAFAAPSRRRSRICTFTPSRRWKSRKARRRSALPVRRSWRELKDAGLGTLPGTAAEILDDEVRAIICPDKVNTAEWLDVVEDGAWPRPAHHRHDHVRPCRASAVLGAASAGHARFAERRRAASPNSCRCPSCIWKRRCISRARRGAGRPSAKRC